MFYFQIHQVLLLVFPLNPALQLKRLLCVSCHCSQASLQKLKAKWYLQQAVCLGVSLATSKS